MKSRSRLAWCVKKSRASLGLVNLLVASPGGQGRGKARALRGKAGALRGVVRKEEQGLIGAGKLVGGVAWGARHGPEPIMQKTQELPAGSATLSAGQGRSRNQSCR